MRALAIVVLVGAVSATGARAAAQTSTDERAHAAFEAGHAAYAAGRYDDALTNFRRAYDLSRRPELLYNVGLAADRLRHDDEALGAFEAYLDAVPEAANRAEVEARVRALRDSVALQMSQVAGAAADARASERTASDVLAEPPPTRPVYDEPLFWILVGVGVVAAIAIPVGIVAGSHTETQPFLTGDVGPGGVVIALSGP
jgi:tetratricopeptide (TPR) repeat protein